MAPDGHAAAASLGGAEKDDVGDRVAALAPNAKAGHPALAPVEMFRVGRQVPHLCQPDLPRRRRRISYPLPRIV